MQSEVCKLKQLEEEYTRLRKLVADLTLDKEMLRLGEPGRLELSDRLTDRRPRDTEFACDVRLVERQSRWQPAAHNVIGQKLPDGLCTRHRTVRFNALSHGDLIA